MNWFYRLAYVSAIACTAFTSLMASTQREEKEAIAIWSQGNKHFTTSFYPQVKDREYNFVFSPLSLQLGLAMTAELALNATQEEIIQTLILPKDSAFRHLGAEKMVNQFKNYKTFAGEEVHLSLANGAWLSSQIQFPVSFQALLKQSYRAALTSADFHTSAEAARQEINSWVEEKTSSQIKNLIPDGSIDSETQLVLVNTLYMRAPWEKPFDPDWTYEDSFYGLEKSLNTIPYMHQRDVFGYLEDAECQVVELPFQPSATNQISLSLFIVLPKEGYSIEEIEEKLTTRKLAHWLTDGEQRDLDLSLPKFKIASTLHVKELLQNLGMHRPFSSQEAEFDLNDDHGKVVITDIVHNTVFEIDELGGMGSSSTGIIIGPTSLPEYIEVKANHPFLIFVADKKSGMILFAGRVMQPKTAS
jgi:serpin B